VAGFFVPWPEATEGACWHGDMRLREGHAGTVTRGHGGRVRGSEAQRLGVIGREVQRCKSAYDLCKSAKVEYESIVTWNESCPQQLFRFPISPSG